MKNRTGSDIWEHPPSDDLGLFDVESSQSSSIMEGAQSVDEITLEDLHNLSNSEEEGKQNLSKSFHSISSRGGELWPPLPGKKRGRKMVLVEVLHDAKTCPNQPAQSKSAPSSPLPSSVSPFHNTLTNEDSSDDGRGVFRTRSECLPSPNKVSTIWRRSFSDTYDPNSMPESPLIQMGVISKRTRLVPCTANHRSLSWSANEERATTKGSRLTLKRTNLDSASIDHLLQENKGGGRLFHPTPKLTSSEGKTDQTHSVKRHSDASYSATRIEHDKAQETVDDLPRQLLQAIYGMRIAQIGGYNEIYQAMQFSPLILTHAGAFCKTFQFFRRQGIFCKVDIGYRYFLNEKEYIPGNKGMLPGICTFNDPFAYYPHDHSGKVQGQLVARLRGNLHNARTTIAHLNASEAAIYTAVEMPLGRSFVQILSSPDQCLPLLFFDSHTVLDLYDNESMGNLVLHTYHQRLQKELDQIFNAGILTKVPFHLPSEHPDFQPI